MGEFSEVRLGAVRRLIEQVPDGTIRSLEGALAGGGRGDRAIAVVHDILSAEMMERRVRAAVFSPLARHCEPNPTLVERLCFPRNALALAWRGVKATDPDLIDQAVRSAVTLRPEDEAPPAFDEICRKVAEGVRAGDKAFEPLIGLLGGPKGQVDKFVQAMAIAPVVRSTLPKLPIWVKTLSNEFAAAIRLAFRDSTAVREDAGPAFMEMLFGHLDEPWQVLRLISLVMDKPSDRYLASSELASFGERLLADIDRRIDALKRFDPHRGLEGGVETAASVHTATTLIDEFGQWLSINREGPWGSRLAAQKRNLALAAESRLREIEPAVIAALPTQPMRFAARSVRGAPRLTEDINPDAVRKAQGLLGFLYETRTCASYGGFGALRTKVVESLDPRVDQYAEDLLEQLHAGEGDLDRLRAYLEVAAEFLGLVREPKAAEIVRRRTAVA
jgi:hypothetical protein